ncbi:MAG TPA: Na+/H+ antiporter [Methylomirabilota bacterium]
MDALYRLEAVVLLLGAVLILMAVARRVLIPYPIFLVIGGLVLGFVPGAPAVRLDPEIVFLIFLPPILWAAAYFTSLRDFQANLRPITLLAVGLVLATTAGVAAVAHAIVPGLGWPAAFVLGAIVSPPDAVAATAVARRLRIPHRVVTILEGESLVNDAAALVLYRAAVVATVTGAFGAKEMLWQFVLAAAGGVAIGLAVGYVTREALHHADDSLVETAITLLVPYAAWILAERLHTSAVLACVVGGIYVRRGFSTAVPPATRIRARAVWDLLVFVLNGVIFVLIGLQLRAIRDAGLVETPGRLVMYGAVISAVAIGIRLVWVPLAAVIPRLVSPALQRRDPMPPWSAVFLLAWTGMRGIVSLAAALGLPLATASGTPFPSRDQIIVVTFEVILATLVLQGLTLSPLIRRLRLGDDTSLELEEAHARQEAGRAALARLDDLAAAPGAPREDIERMRTLYTQRVQRASSIDPGASAGSARAQAALRRLRHETLSAERRALIALRDDGVISDDILHRLEQELDIEAMRIGLGEERLPGHSHG